MSIEMGTGDLKKAKYSEHLVKGRGKLAYVANNQRSLAIHSQSLQMGVTEFTLKSEHLINLKLKSTNLRKKPMDSKVKMIDSDKLGKQHG